MGNSSFRFHLVQCSNRFHAKKFRLISGDADEMACDDLC